MSPAARACRATSRQSTISKHIRPALVREAGLMLCAGTRLRSRGYGETYCPDCDVPFVDGPYAVAARCAAIFASAAWMFSG